MTDTAAKSGSVTAATATSGRSPATIARLWVEFVILFVGTPVAMTVSFPDVVGYFGTFPLIPMLMVLAMLALALLSLTPGFRLAELIRGPVFGEWRLILRYAIAVLAVCFTVALSLVPDRLLEMPRHYPELWALTIVGYPFVSVVPQELIYRPLFFRRYGRLFPNVGTAIAINAVAFGLGHLIYMSWVTVLMTMVGGSAMGWVYMRHRSFLLAVVMHAVAGQIIFTSGLGIYFYHGAIGMAH